MQVSSGRGGVIFSIASETDYVLNSYISERHQNEKNEKFTGDNDVELAIGSPFEVSFHAVAAFLSLSIDFICPFVYPVQNLQILVNQLTSFLYISLHLISFL